MGILGDNPFVALGNPGTGYQIQQSLRFNSGDSAYLNRTPAIAGNQRTWTFSVWLKRSELKQVGIFCPVTGGDGSNESQLRIKTDNTFQVYDSGGLRLNRTSTRLFRDPFAWFHLVVAVDTTQATDTNRVKIYVNGLQITDESGTLPGQNTDLGWNNTSRHDIGRYAAGAEDYFDGYMAEMHHVDGTQLDADSFGEFDDSGVWRPKAFIPPADRAQFPATTVVYRDGWSASALNPYYSFDGLLWRGTAVNGNTNATWSGSIDTSGATTVRILTAFGANSGQVGGAGDLVKVNNTDISGKMKTANAYLTLTWIDITTEAGNEITSLYMNAISGVSNPSIAAIDIDGVVVVDELSGYGENGAYLKFDPDATNGIGHDHSGNGNNFTASGFTTSGTGTDVMSDTPTTNWCTLNQLSYGPSNADVVEGSLRFNTPTASVGNAKGTIAVSSGKWYWEVTPQTTATANVAGGILGAAETSIASQPGEYATGYAYLGNGERSNNSTETSYGDTYGADDVIGTALDLDAGTLVFYKNGVSQGTAFSGLSGTFVPAIGDTSSTSGANLVCNFGQREFEYTPPIGFKALNTSNLPTPDIADGSKYFNTVLYTGTVTDTSTQSVTGVGFKSDWTWIKRRDSGNSHQLVDAVRGAGSWLETNSNNQENSTNTNGVLTSFDADGFTLTGGSTNANLCCEDGFTYASWNWLAGNSTSSNTDGTISSTVSVNRKAGLSIVTYTGTGVNATVGHGLGVQPSFYVVKPRSVSNNWPCWHKDLTSDSYYIHLNFALKQDLAATVWNGTGPSSTVFNIGTNTNVNQDEATFVAYVFAEVPGYSRISFYPGNGSTTGPFIWTGFRPSYLLIKNYRGGSETNWLIRDSARAPFNQMQAFLYANTDVAEGNNFPIDFLSNGFKIRDDNAIFNESGSDFLFLAFAENPFGGFRTTPVTAR